MQNKAETYHLKYYNKQITKTEKCKLVKKRETLGQATQRLVHKLWYAALDGWNGCR